ncbi:MAG: methyltransferase domain-containing protein [Nitrososphaerota archaeon]|nr:methyltransferase domain-containing protein [Nitrososphaerota archaeon]
MRAPGDEMKLASSKIFAGLAGSYEKALGYATLFQDRRWKYWVARRLKAGRGDLVLDVGSGTLVLEEFLAMKECRFIALDLAPEMIRVAAEKRMPNVDLVLNGDAEFLPFPDRSFDSVVSCYVPKYVDVGKFAEEVARVAKPGAAVVLYDFAKPRGPLAPFLEIYIRCGLRLAGVALRLARREEAFTFDRLPQIIENTTWDLDMVEAMKSNGFVEVESDRLTGGVVFACSGRRGESLGARRGAPGWSGRNGEGPRRS